MIFYLVKRMDVIFSNFSMMENIGGEIIFPLCGDNAYEYP
jgi:hypothetical protein